MYNNTILQWFVIVKTEVIVRHKNVTALSSYLLQKNV